MTALLSLAVTVLDELKDRGVDVALQPTGELSIFIPQPGVGRRPDQRDEYVRGHDDGFIRALVRLLLEQPALNAEACQVIAEFPSGVYNDGLLA